jgi:hypothetical protein
MRHRPSLGAEDGKSQHGMNLKLKSSARAINRVAGLSMYDRRLHGNEVSVLQGKIRLC